MNPVLLHIGLTKTATSSIQNSLKKIPDLLDRSGYVYPTAGRSGPGRSAHHNLFYEIGLPGQGNGTFEVVRGGWSQALAEIDAVAGRTGIISSEAFQYCTAEQVAAIRSRLGERHATVIVYLRRHDRWLESSFGQRARFGRVGLDFWDFYESIGQQLADYAATLTPWLEVFGDRRVDVRIYERATSGRGIVADFVESALTNAEALGDIDQTTRRNAKVGVSHLLAVAAVLALCRAELGDDFVLPRETAIEISGFFRGRPDRLDYSILNFESAKAIERFFRTSNGRLALLSSSARTNGGFTAPRADEFENYIDLVQLSRDDGFDDEERLFVGRVADKLIRLSA